jgi:hypothetical protein
MAGSLTFVTVGPRLMKMQRVQLFFIRVHFFFFLAIIMFLCSLMFLSVFLIILFFNLSCLKAISPNNANWLSDQHALYAIHQKTPIVCHLI